MDIPRVNILGVGISALNMDKAVAAIDEYIACPKPRYVSVSAVHNVMEAQVHPELRDVYNNNALMLPEGMPLVWLSKLMGHRDSGRVGGPDFFITVCEKSVTKEYRHFLYGGPPGLPEELALKLEERFPGIQIVGTHSPPFRPLTPEEDAEEIRIINTAEPDIVWVALGVPKQDRWMAAHVGKLNTSVLVGVGYAFDVHAGRKKQAPLWMQRSALEWLFRLIDEPHRLAYRYLVYNSLFVLLIMTQALGLRKYQIEPASHQKQRVL